MLMKRYVGEINFKLDVGIRQFVKVPRLNPKTGKMGYIWVDSGVTEYNFNLDLISFDELGELFSTYRYAIDQNHGCSYKNNITGTLIICRDNELYGTHNHKWVAFDERKLKPINELEVFEND